MRLTFNENGQTRDVEVNGGPLVIGRDPRCDLVIADEKVSSRHASIETLPDGTLQLTDLGSTNGTVVDGQRVEGPVTLHEGQQIKIGRAMLTVSGTADGTDAPPLAVAPVAPPQAVAPAQPEAPPQPEPRPQPETPSRPAFAPPPEAAPQPSRLRRMSESIGRSQSTVIRQLQRTTRRVTVLAAVAVLVAVGVGVAAALGAFSSSTPTPTQIARAVAPSTVYIYGTVPGGAESGSGWVLDAGKGLIVTNDHVAEGASSLQVAVGTAPGASVMSSRRPATIVGADPCQDIALLKVSNTSGLKTLPLGSQSTLSAGDGVVALGFPETAANATNFQNAVLIITSGTVSSPKTQYDVPVAAGGGAEANLPNVIQLPADVITHGNSGGPLVNDSDQLVGMNTAGYNGSTGGSAPVATYAIGVDQIKALIPQLMRGPVDTAGFILDPGVDTAVSSQITGFPQGIVVDGAVSGSPAANLGLNYFGGNRPPYNSTSNPPPTILQSINGTQLSDSKASYCSAVQRLSSGQAAAAIVTVPVAVNSSGQIQYTTDTVRAVFR
jgi:S1-C subfamily serine protease